MESFDSESAVMEENFDDQENDTLEEETSEDLKLYIQQNIIKPEESSKDAMIIVKPLWGNFFRVNFIETIYEDEAVVPDHKVSASKFIEVVETNDNSGKRIIDKTQ